MAIREAVGDGEFVYAGDSAADRLHDAEQHDAERIDRVAEKHREALQQPDLDEHEACFLRRRPPCTFAAPMLFGFGAREWACPENSLSSLAS